MRTKSVFSRNAKESPKHKKKKTWKGGAYSVGKKRCLEGGTDHTEKWFTEGKAAKERDHRTSECEKGDDSASSEGGSH